MNEGYVGQEKFAIKERDKKKSRVRADQYKEEIKRGVKTCSKCKEVLPLSSFTKSDSYTDGTPGYKSNCRQCTKRSWGEERCKRCESPGIYDPICPICLKNWMIHKEYQKNKRRFEGPGVKEEPLISVEWLTNVIKKKREESGEEFFISRLSRESGISGHQINALIRRIALVTSLSIADRLLTAMGKIGPLPPEAIAYEHVRDLAKANGSEAMRAEIESRKSRAKPQTDQTETS